MQQSSGEKGKEQQKEINRGFFISIVNEVGKKAEGGGFHENKNRTINGAKYIPKKWWRLMQEVELQNKTNTQK